MAASSVVHHPATSAGAVGSGGSCLHPSSSNEDLRRIHQIGVEQLSESTTAQQPVTTVQKNLGESLTPAEIELVGIKQSSSVIIPVGSLCIYDGCLFQVISTDGGYVIGDGKRVLLLSRRSPMAVNDRLILSDTDQLPEAYVPSSSICASYPSVETYLGVDVQEVFKAYRNDPPPYLVAEVCPGVNVQKVFNAYGIRDCEKVKEIYCRNMRVTIDIDPLLEKNARLAAEQGAALKRYFNLSYGRSIVERDAVPSTERGEFYLDDSPGSYETLMDGAVGDATNRGRRPGKNEDHHIAVSFEAGEQQVKLTGIFDGHGGTEAAKFVQDNIQETLKYRLEVFKGTKPELSDVDIYNALKLIFVDLSQKFISSSRSVAGTTATIQVAINGKLWIANVGDSRTIFLDKDGKATQVSEDACNIERFTKGIKRREGELNENGRLVYRYENIAGSLGVLRAIGDQRVKGLNSRSKTVREDLKDGYTIHVCDGITDVLDTDQIGHFVHGRLTKGDSLVQAAKALVEYAYAIGSQDNLSVQIVDHSKL